MKIKGKLTGTIYKCDNHRGYSYRWVQVYEPRKIFFGLITYYKLIFEGPSNTISKSYLKIFPEDLKKAYQEKVDEYEEFKAAWENYNVKDTVY